MKILILINENVVGGAEVQAKNFYDWCEKNEIDARLLFLKGRCKSKKSILRLLEKILCQNVFIQFIRLISVILKYEPDILDAHLSRSCYAAIIAKFVHPKLKVVINNHTNVFEYYQSRGISGRCNLFLTKKLFSFADLILCVSNYNKIDLKNLVNFQKVNVSVLPNAFEIPKQFTKNTQNKKQKELFTVVYVGRLVMGKNVDAIIKSFKHLPSNYNLSIVGDGPLRKQLVDLVTCQRITSDRISFVGFKDDIRKYYQASDMSILASSSESFGNVVIESFSHGKPILVYSLAKGASEILKKHKLDLEFHSLDPRNIALEILRLAQDHDKITNIEGYYKVASEYSIDHVYPNKIQTLRNLL